MKMPKFVKYVIQNAPMLTILLIGCSMLALNYYMLRVNPPIQYVYRQRVKYIYCTKVVDYRDGRVLVKECEPIDFVN